MRYQAEGRAEFDQAEKRGLYLWWAGYFERNELAFASGFIPFFDGAIWLREDHIFKLVLSSVDANDGNGADF